MMGEIRNASYEALREIMTPTGPYIVASSNQEFIVFILNELLLNEMNRLR